jgi:hypothetical protein
MSLFITTIRYTVYVPRPWHTIFSLETKFEVIAHELVHLMQYKRLRIIQPLFYLMPQILALLVFLAFISPWFLLCLLFLLPLPSLGRYIYEFAGYRMSLYCVYLIYGSNVNREKIIEYYVSYFTKGNYYFMWPFTKSLTKRFQSCYNDFENGKLTKLEEDIKKILS